MKNLIILCLVIWAFVYFYKDGQRLVSNIGGSLHEAASSVKDKLSL